MAPNKRKIICFVWFIFFMFLVGCNGQVEPEIDTAPIITRTATASPIPTQTAIPTITPTMASAEMITSVAIPSYLYEVFPEPAGQYDISSEEYWAVLDQFESHLSSSVCVAVSSYHLMEKGDAPSAEEFLSQMYLVVDEAKMMVPNAVVAPDIFGTDFFDDSGEFLFRTPDGEDFNVCWPADLSNPGLHTATFIFTKTSGTLESYTWSFIIEE